MGRWCSEGTKLRHVGWINPEMNRAITLVNTTVLSPGNPLDCRFHVLCVVFTHTQRVWGDGCENWLAVQPFNYVYVSQSIMLYTWNRRGFHLQEVLCFFLDKVKKKAQAHQQPVTLRCKQWPARHLALQLQDKEWPSCTHLADASVDLRKGPWTSLHPCNRWYFWQNKMEDWYISVFPSIVIFR